MAREALRRPVIHAATYNIKVRDNFVFCIASNRYRSYHSKYLSEQGHA